MKVLVVDDDVVARKVLGAFLKQSNYEMSIVEDGRSAFHALTAPDAPHVAIVDWMMPDINGPELCAKLRQHPFAVQPYLLMLSGRKEKIDVAAALDAGADDFISKPFNIQEMQARLRVATRSVERQLDLLHQLDELRVELAKERARMLPAAGAFTTGAFLNDISGTTESPAPENARTGIARLDHHRIDAVVANALRKAGQMPTPRRLTRCDGAFQRIAWAGILLTKDEAWVDIFIETNPAGAKGLFDQAGVPVSPSGNPRRYCEKLLTSLRDLLAAALQGLGSEIQTPLDTAAIHSDDGALPIGDRPLERHAYCVGGAEFTLAFAEHPCPLRAKATHQLQPFDVLAQPYPPPTTQQVPLLRAGVVLKEQLIEKLQDFASATAIEVPPVLVHTPSPVALQLQESTGFAGRA